MNKLESWKIAAEKVYRANGKKFIRPHYDVWSSFDEATAGVVLHFHILAQISTESFILISVFVIHYIVLQPNWFFTYAYEYIQKETKNRLT